MKYWSGYLTAAIIGAVAWALLKLGNMYSALVDMVYPYVSRTLMEILAQWSSSVDFCLWQLAAAIIVVFLIASIVVMFVMKWNPIRWLGWVLAGASVIFLLNTMVFGLNYHAGSIAADIRMEVTEQNVESLAEAAAWYRDKANDLASQVERDENGDAAFAEFDELALQAADGFDALVYEYSYPIFAGCTLPVKELGWANMYSSMGITGVTLGLTGEAAVNPQIPDITLPFTMCHEMAHRMSIATEGDANFAAFLACQANESIQFQYSAYFMAYRYCYNSLNALNTMESSAAAARVVAGVSELVQHDMDAYSDFFSSRKDATATKVANTVNDTYLKTSGDESGIASYGEVTDLLVSWHYQTVVLPTITFEEQPFDPLDEKQVDLSGIANAKEQEEAVG